MNIDYFTMHGERCAAFLGPMGEYYGTFTFPGTLADPDTTTPEARAARERVARAIGAAIEEALRVE